MKFAMLRPTIAQDALAWSNRGDRSALERLLLAYPAISSISATAAIALARATRSSLDEAPGLPLSRDPHESEAFLLWRSAAREARANREPRPLQRLLESPASSAPKVAAAALGNATAPSALPPEAPRPVPTPNRPLSASALNMFVDCRRRWFYRYVCDPIDEPNAAAASYGTAFHAALEHFHAEFARPSEALRAEMQQRLDALVVEAFERARPTFDTVVEVELQKQRARRTALRYIDWLCERAEHLPFEVIGIERRVSPTIGERQFVGFIDRIDRFDRDGSLAVIDYKTGSIAESAKEYRERVRRFEDFQLPFYYWSQQLAGETVSRLALVPLKDHTIPVMPIELEVVSAAAPSRDNGARGTISLLDLERARDRMVDLADEIRSERIAAFTASTDPESCAYCIYTLACRARPQPEPERFSR
ncbi:MAG: RecB family exonuclease [Candidatus Baltobacteraceae bacterium]